MKFSTVASVATLLAAPVLSAPTDIKYGPPKGGWESVDYTGAGENLEHYPAPPGGWENGKQSFFDRCLKKMSLSF